VDDAPTPITDLPYENPWLHGGLPLSLPDEELEKLVGFVYLIQCLENGKSYVGQKLLWSPKVLPKNSKRKRRVRTRVPSDWKDYYGSSEELRADVARLGTSSFRREILHLCTSKGNMNYLELREQVLREVLLREDYYNSYVGGRIHRKHVSQDLLS
jgi:hypothetical protein